MTPAKPYVVSVYAGSGDMVDDVLKEAAYDLGKAIAEEGWVQRNGGGHTGLMGAVTKGGNDNDGIVDCVILSMFMDSDPQIGQRYRSIEVEDTLEARRTGLNKGADAFIALPGGLGTLDELTEVMCMRQLSFHERPIVLINTASFYDPIRQFLESGVEKRFIAADVRRTIHFADTPEEAIAFLKTYKPTKIDKETINSSELRKTT